MTTSRKEFDFWLLDLDGTLVDIETPYIYEVFEKVGRELNVTFTDREAEFLWYGIGDARNTLLDERDIGREQFWNVFHEVENGQSRAKATYLYDDAVSFVPELDKPVGVVTHCQEYLTDPVLERLDITDWFDTVICCTDETGWKPDPDPIERAMRELDVDARAERGYYAGDGECDVGAAWNAGLEAVHVERVGHDDRGRCVLGDRRVESFDELW